MDEDKMTIPQALEMTKNLLGNIMVPRYLNEVIGVPIDHAICNIQLCIDAYHAAETQKQEAVQHDTEPVPGEEPLFPVNEEDGYGEAETE